jgi:hypothetical protein
MAWKESIAQSTETGAVHSQGFPLTPEELCNSIGQKYTGPVVLITDALCYSTTDMFAAGFQDHEVGKILGASANTGAGGANVYTHDDLRQLLPGAGSPFRPLPNGASFRVALRRSARVGARTGVLLEDLGVVPDEAHAMTRNDVLNDNVDLINHAGKLLVEMPSFTLTGASAQEQPPATGWTLTIQSENLDRVDVLLDGRPRLTLDVVNGHNVANLPATAGQATVELRGFRGRKLVAASRFSAANGPAVPPNNIPSGIAK